jgi:hypothetical protein
MTMRAGLEVAAAVLAAGVVGCSGGTGAVTRDASTEVEASSNQDGGGITDAGTGTDGSSVHDAAASLCPFAAPNDASCSGVQLVGFPIAPTCSSSPVPAGDGGVVASGRYVLESIEIYPTTGGCPPASALTGQVTWIICGIDWATVNDFPGPDGGPQVRQFDVTASMDASALALTIECPFANASQVVHYQYSARPGHFSLIYPTTYNGNGLGYTFTEEDDFALQ